jgi:hypothetical protein
MPIVYQKRLGFKWPYRTIACMKCISLLMSKLFLCLNMMKEDSKKLTFLLWRVGE